MKLLDILVLLTLSVVVKGTWWATAVQPVILSMGAILAAIDLDTLNLQPIEWENWQIFKSDTDKTQTVTQDEEEESKTQFVDSDTETNENQANWKVGLSKKDLELIAESIPDSHWIN